MAVAVHWKLAVVGSHIVVVVAVAAAVVAAEVIASADSVDRY